MGYVTDIRESIGRRPLLLCAVGCLVFDDKGRVLLQRRNDDNLWGNPGGIVELGESIYDTVKRELLEETGIMVRQDAFKLFNIYSGNEQHHIYPNGDVAYFVNVIFRIDKYCGKFEINDNESRELKFFSLYNIPQDITKTFDCIIKDLI